MCDNPHVVWLVRDPKPFYGRFIIKTRQYNEYAQYGKEYILFKSKKNFQIVKKFSHCQDVYLPCGKCIQCVNSRSRNWSLRSTLELSKFDTACCLTLTYNDENLPKDGLLYYKDFQLFLKKLRNYLSKRYKQYGLECPQIKYIVCGEYGKNFTLRPHFHAIIMGYFPEDINLAKPYKVSKKGTKLYKSKLIDNLWNKGFVDIGSVNHQTCRYISQYCCKKFIVTNSTYKEKCEKKREFLHASIGFGLSWFVKNYQSVINAGKIVLGGFTFGIPRYFIRKLEDIDLQLFTKFKEKMHRNFLNYRYDEAEKRRLKAISDRLLSKFKIFMSDSDEIFLLDNLHNIHYSSPMYSL